jgi:hypothetical protein
VVSEAEASEDMLLKQLRRIDQQCRYEDAWGNIEELLVLSVGLRRLEVVFQFQPGESNRWDVVSVTNKTV